MTKAMKVENVAIKLYQYQRIEKLTLISGVYHRKRRGSAWRLGNVRLSGGPESVKEMAINLMQ